MCCFTVYQLKSSGLQCGDIVDSTVMDPDIPDLSGVQDCMTKATKTWIPPTAGPVYVSGFPAVSRSLIEATLEHSGSRTSPIYITTIHPIQPSSLPKKEPPRSYRNKSKI
ncbi:hypothetical protein Bbelb_226690 [Branchiostoma belcheri]|nr:hypothetical protein Bbelb_226690 [Branchiostoma belcheri]